MKFQSNERRTIDECRKEMYPNRDSSTKIGNFNEIIDNTSILTISSNNKQAARMYKKIGETKIMPKSPHYNPYKIMGFQNKETNDFAKNVLKAQALGPNTFTIQPSTAYKIPKAIEKSSSQAAAYHIYDKAMQPHTTSRTTISESNEVAPIKRHPSNQITYTWNFCIGDRCLAKYWEDEHVSDILRPSGLKTCTIKAEKRHANKHEKTAIYTQKKEH